MRFEWDEAKRQINLRKHRLDFADARVVFEGQIITAEDARFDYGEIRLNTFGRFLGVVVKVTYTDRDDVIRLISFRKATKHEQRGYYDYFGN